MAPDAFALNPLRVFRNRGIAAYSQEWHHILQEAEIFAWSSRKTPEDDRCGF
jgi:hypothetical protein